MAANTIPDATPGMGGQAEAWFLDLMTHYGAGALFVVCLASCLALPVPASLVMISAAALAATGEMALWQVAAACFAGAIVGDVIAYSIGKAGRGPLVRWLDSKPASREGRLKAEAWVHDRGGPGILFSRWPASPLGPYVNYAAGAIGYGRKRFMAWTAAGEALWVSVNVSLGYFFSQHIKGIMMVVHEAAGIILSLLALILLVWALRRYTRHRANT